METEWQIYSLDHDGWWKPNSNGYTNNRENAGIYSLKEATEICAGANAHLSGEQEPREAMVPYV